MLHLHGFDDGKALALLDPVARLDEYGDQLAVHRRLDRRAASRIAAFQIDRQRINQLHPRLSALPHHDHAFIGHHQREITLGVRNTAKINRDAINAPARVEQHRLAIGHDGHRHGWLRRQCKSVSQRPGIIGPATARRVVSLFLHQQDRASRNGSHVDRLRNSAKRLGMALDEARVEAAGAERFGFAELFEEGHIGFRPSHHGAAQRQRQPV